MKGQTYVILTFVFVILIAIFAVTNVESVEVNYFFWKRESPLILLILFSVLMGGLLTMVAGSIKYFNLQRENRQLAENIKRLKTELSKYTTVEFDEEVNQQAEDTKANNHHD